MPRSNVSILPRLAAAGLAIGCTMLAGRAGRGEAPGSHAHENGPSIADGRCDACGARWCVTKVCVPTPTEKEITKACWDSRCEDFRVPGRSVWCGTTCGEDDCGCWSHDVWKPTCAEVRTRVIPVRKTTTRKVAAVEWKVEERCPRCRHSESGTAPTCAARDDEPTADETDAGRGSDPVALEHPTWARLWSTLWR